MSSVREVAELAGVSVGTVSRYLNGQQLKAANQAKIAAAIEQLDYKQNIIAKGLKNNQSFSIGLLMNSISSRFAASRSIPCHSSPAKKTIKPSIECAIK